ncbi:hypothetical protein Tco_0445076 [Tanacetum coccineum]
MGSNRKKGGNPTKSEITIANDMLKELKALFAQQAEQELLQTTRDFHACKQEEGQIVSSYVLRMKAIIQSRAFGAPVTLGPWLSMSKPLNLPKNQRPAQHAITSCPRFPPPPPKRKYPAKGLIFMRCGDTDIGKELSSQHSQSWLKKKRTHMTQPLELVGFRVSCYTDAGYLTDADDLKSQTGYVFVLNGGAVDWKSAKQSIFATSSAEAEYIAAFDASKELLWAIAIANESGITKGARHFRAKVHYLREVIEFGDIKLEKVHTDDNLADPFTKALAFPKHSELTRNIGMLH